MTLPTLESEWTVAPFRFGTAEQFARLREFLVRAHYTGAEICERLGIGTIHDFQTVKEGRPLTPELTDAQTLLLRLFMDAEPVDWSVVRSLLPPDGLEALEALGLLHTIGDGTQCAATVLLYPTESLFIVSDRNQDPDASPIRPPADVVYPAITRNTQRFMAMLPRAPCDSFLDLCAGTGIAALVASRHAKHAWAVDVTERATRFAQFNALLNDIGNVTAVQGNLYEPVRGQTFDRIVAHPPYMPAFQQEYVFRDGGEDGELITRRIVAGVPDHLRPGGRFYCVCMATDRKGAPLEARLREMLGERAGEFDVVVGQMQTYQPTDYYCRNAQEGKGRFADLEQRHQLFERLQVERLIYCVVVIQRKADARPAFTTRRQMSADTASAEFEWLLRWETAAADPELPRRLLRAKPVISPRVELRLVHRLRGGEWITAECSAATRYPFAVEAMCPVWVARLLMRCDGTATVREQLEYLKDTGAVAQEAAEEEFVRMVQGLVAGGFLEIEGFELPSARQ